MSLKVENIFDELKFRLSFVIWVNGLNELLLFRHFARRFSLLVIQFYNFFALSFIVLCQDEDFLVL